MQGTIKLKTFATAAANIVSTPLHTLLGQQARVMGFLFSTFIATDSVTAILYLEAPAGTQTPVWAYGYDFTTSVTTKTRTRWLGVDRTPTDIPNWVFGGGAPAVNTDYGSWPMGIPVVFEGDSSGTAYRGLLRLQVTNVNAGTLTLVYLDGNIPQDNIV